MRPIVVLGIVALAFAAGWLLRGCADERTSRSANAPAASRPIETPATPLHRARPTSRGAEESPSSRAPTSETKSPAAPPRDLAEAPPLDARNDEPVHRVSGVVVDSLGGVPVADVRILLCGPSGWHGDRTDAAGRFSCDMEPEWNIKTDRIEVRAGRDGYRPTRIAATTAEVRVELEKLIRVPRPGRVVGTARGEDGKPLVGRLLVGIKDDLDLHSDGVWTVADGNGRFAIDGVATDHWTLRLAESDDSFEVNVPEGSEASVELRAKFSRPPTGAFAAGELTEAHYTREKARLDAIMFSGAGPNGGPQFDSAGYAGQQLDLQWLRYAPGRDVVVTGVSATDGAFVRLDHREGAGCQWRASVADGTAKFPSIPFGKWRAVFVRPGKADAMVDVDVKAGDGALTVEMAAVK